MTDRELSTTPTVDTIYKCLANAAAEAALALGLVRVLTLLPLYDTSLDELERHLAQTWESLLELKRLLEDERLPVCSTRPRAASD
jgi:DMSO/TMAO reductase YedYZ heme-binding membrane subunit